MQSVFVQYAEWSPSQGSEIGNVAAETGAAAHAAVPFPVANSGPVSGGQQRLATGNGVWYVARTSQIFSPSSR